MQRRGPTTVLYGLCPKTNLPLQLHVHLVCKREGKQAGGTAGKKPRGLSASAGWFQRGLSMYPGIPHLLNVGMPSKVSSSIFVFYVQTTSHVSASRIYPVSCAIFF